MEDTRFNLLAWSIARPAHDSAVVHVRDRPVRERAEEPVSRVVLLWWHIDDFRCVIERPPEADRGRKWLDLALDFGLFVPGDPVDSFLVWTTKRFVWKNEDAQLNDEQLPLTIFFTPF